MCSIDGFKITAYHIYNAIQIFPTDFILYLAKENCYTLQIQYGELKYNNATATIIDVDKLTVTIIINSKYLPILNIKEQVCLYCYDNKYQEDCPALPIEYIPSYISILRKIDIQRPFVEKLIREKNFIVNYGWKNYINSYIGA